MIQVWQRNIRTGGRLRRNGLFIHNTFVPLLCISYPSTLRCRHHAYSPNLMPRIQKECLTRAFALYLFAPGSEQAGRCQQRCCPLISSKLKTGLQQFLAWCVWLARVSARVTVISLGLDDQNGATNTRGNI